ncbi:MAG: hypothetical protein F6K56_35535 [Moorea sp. SIO3G5]|nr:hypothetical protein [Moorena sp. SIO3G5]
MNRILRERQEARGKRQELIKYIVFFGNQKMVVLVYKSFGNAIYRLAIARVVLYPD